jgi:hypothetical protein
LIPVKDDRDIKSELEKKRGDSYRAALEEHNELVQQLTAKNRHLKEIIDQVLSLSKLERHGLTYDSCFLFQPTVRQE